MTVQEAVQPTLEDDLFSMANLFPNRTGLPFIVWVSTGTGAKHDVRVKIARGRRVLPSEFISVAIRPELRVIGEGVLSNEELALLNQWVDLNRDVIMAFWLEEIDTGGLLERLQTI